MINENVLKGNWKVLKGEIQKKWGQLTSDELDQVQGDTNRLMGLMQAKLGYKQEEARNQLHEFMKAHNEFTPKKPSDPTGVM